jgi:hypothetical protein
MQTRLRSLQRILAVQEDLKRLAEWKLAILQHKETGLQKDQERLVLYLDENHSFSTSYAKTISARLQALAAQKHATAAERVQQTERVLDQTRRVGQVERMIDTAAGALRRDEERKELADTIEAAVNRKQASPR